MLVYIINTRQSQFKRVPVLQTHAQPINVPAFHERVLGSADQDQTLQNAASDQDLHCLQ